MAQQSFPGGSAPPSLQKGLAERRSSPPFLDASHAGCLLLSAQQQNRAPKRPAPQPRAWQGLATHHLEVPSSSRVLALPYLLPQHRGSSSCTGVPVPLWPALVMREDVFPARNPLPFPLTSPGTRAPQDKASPPSKAALSYVDLRTCFFHPTTRAHASLGPLAVGLCAWV